jgi:hypothetical protein
MGAMPNKTDRNDARGIAQIMRTGWYRAVHVKSPSCRSWRALLTPITPIREGSQLDCRAALRGPFGLVTGVGFSGVV